MKIATWNVNSVKARWERLLAFLAREQPDCLCLQELKVTDDQFPQADLAREGYEAAIHGEKAYNGVAILSRTSLADVRTGMNDGEDDPQARIISALSGRVRLVSVYVPNGGEPGSSKFTYKLRWLARLRRHVAELLRETPDLILCGDLNIAPDGRDVARPEQWNDSVLCRTEVREEFQQLLQVGLVDVVRQHHPAGGLYSWWDYRMLGFAKNNGLRIDHILASPSLAGRCTGARVDRDERKGKRPSDHAPVIAAFTGP